MAVRRELVFDECGGAKRRRRQAHVFLTAQINNLTRRAEKGIRADPLANCLFYPAAVRFRLSVYYAVLKRVPKSLSLFPFVDNCGNFSRKIQTNV